MHPTNLPKQCPLIENSTVRNAELCGNSEVSTNKNAMPQHGLKMLTFTAIYKLSNENTA
jgi:hypothetical protein